MFLDFFALITCRKSWIRNTCAPIDIPSVLKHFLTAYDKMGAPNGTSVSYSFFVRKIEIMTVIFMKGSFHKGAWDSSFLPVRSLVFENLKRKTKSVRIQLTRERLTLKWCCWSLVFRVYRHLLLLYCEKTILQSLGYECHVVMETPNNSQFFLHMPTRFSVQLLHKLRFGLLCSLFDASSALWSR